tara:strand:+ start:207 stop:485 length:279 start_codon:yes stop_codon:yes gene_type:complete
MKTFKEFWGKKGEIDKDQEELEKLGLKAAGRGGWSKKEQHRYNLLWMKMHNKGQTPIMSPPSVYDDDSWGTKTIKLQKKLRLTKKDHSGVLA